MRITEIAGNRRVALSTTRFDKEIAAFIQQAPAISQSLQQFLEFRSTALPQNGFGKKDAVFTAGLLKGYRHVHLVHGKVIAIYDITSSATRLYCAVTHKDTEGANPTVVGFLKNTSEADFHPFTLLDAAAPATLSREQVQAILDAFYDLASNPADRPMLAAVVEGRFDPSLIEYLSVSADLEDSAETRAMIAHAFGGASGLQAKVAEILKQTA